MIIICHSFATSLVIESPSPKAERSGAAALSRKDVAPFIREKVYCGGRARRRKEEGPDGHGLPLKESVRQGSTVSRVQRPYRNKYNENPRLTSRIDNDLLPIERVRDRSPSIFLDSRPRALTRRSPKSSRVSG